MNSLVDLLYSLREETIRVQTHELISEIIHTALTDADILKQSSIFLAKVFDDERTKKQGVAFLHYLFNDPQTFHTLSRLLTQVVVAVLEDEATKLQLIQLSKDIVTDKDMKRIILKFLNDLVNDPRTKVQFSDLFGWVFQQDPVKRSVSGSLMNAAHKVLRDENVQTHAKEFVSKIVEDQTIQVQGGDAIRNSLLYSVTPQWVWKDQEKEINEEGMKENSGKEGEVKRRRTRKAENAKGEGREEEGKKETHEEREEKEQAIGQTGKPGQVGKAEEQVEQQMKKGRISNRISHWLTKKEKREKENAEK